MIDEEKKRDHPISSVSKTFPSRHFNEFAQNSIDSSSTSNGCFFDPHCPECVRELWGPLLSPFAYLIKQNAQYFNEILTKIDQNQFEIPQQTTQRRFQSTGDSPVKRPKRQIDDHKFLTSTGSCALETGKYGWFLVATIGFGLIGVTIFFLVFNDEQIPPVVAILRMESAADWGLEFPFKLLLIVIGVIGILLIVTGFVAFFVTMRRAEKLTYAIVIFAGLLVLVQIGLLIYYFVSRSQVTSEILETLENSFTKNYGSNDDGAASVTEAWNRAFQKYRCCGWKDADFSTTKWTSTSVDLPESCCVSNAETPACQSNSAGSSMNYANSNCQTEIEESVSSTQTVVIISVIAALVIISQIAIAFATFWYLSALKIARSRRKRYNRRQKAKFAKKMKKNKKKTKDTSTPVVPSNDQVQVDDLRQLYNHYTSFHKNPPDFDPGVMSITPTVIQVKRPNVYSYFYYE